MDNVDNKNPLLEAALEYLKLGWWIFPTREVDGEKYWNQKKETWITPPAKSPYIRGGLHSASNNPEQIKSWWNQYPNAGIGVNCGKSKIFVVDVDNHVLDGKTTGIDNFMKMGIPHRDTWQSYTPSGGLHLIYSDPNGIGKSHSNEMLQIDTRGDGGYIILPSSWLMVWLMEEQNGEWVKIKREKRAYTKIGKWEGKPMEILPKYLEILNPEKSNSPAHSEKKSDFNVDNQRELARLTSALSAIGAEYCDNRSDWIKIGMALSGLGEIGFELWDGWSKQSDKYNRSDLIKQWDSFIRLGYNQVTVGTIFWYAKQSGWNWR